MIEELSGDFLQKLRGFYFVAQTGSFSQAAAKMYRNQSTVSHQIKLLEEELGINLFIRTGQGVQLSKHGEALLPHVIELFDKISNIMETFSSSANKIERIVNIQAHPLPLTKFIKNALPSLKEEFPDIIFNFMQEQARPKMLDALDNNLSDFCIAGLDNLSKNYLKIPLYEMKFHIIAHKDFDLPKKLTLENIASLPHISLGEFSNITKDISNVFEKKNLQLNILHTVNLWQILYNMVESGSGVAIVSEVITNSSLTENLQQISLEHLFKGREIGLIYKPSPQLNQQAQDVFEFIVKNKNLLKQEI